MHLGDLLPHPLAAAGGRPGPAGADHGLCRRPFELAHRRLIAAASGDTDHALPEEVLALAGAAIRQTVAGPTRRAAAAARSRAKDAALAAAARDGIAADHPAARGLFPLAELLGVSPYRLSRGFSRELGMSLTPLLQPGPGEPGTGAPAAGEPSLGILAADLGFADQAHLTRTMRAYAGHTPLALRRLLQR